MLKLSQTFPLKRAFITGAGSGLGKALSLRLAADGWTIGMTDVNETALQAVADEVENAGGKPVLYIFDVSKREDFQAATEAFLEAVKGVDVVINNAGVGDGGQFVRYSLERWDWMIGINQMGVIYGCHYFLPAMYAAESGQLINIASAAGFANSGGIASYNVTKAAVNALSECLYYESAPKNVRVSVVMPTFFKTNIAAGWRGSERGRAGAQKLVDDSGLEAAAVAEEILTRAGKGEFRIVLPKKARRLYRMVRFFPRMYQKDRLKAAFNRLKNTGK